MILPRPSLTLLVAVLALASPAAAQMRDEGRACTTLSDAALPPALAAWTRRTPVAAAAAPAALAASTLAVGRAADAQLKRVGEVTYPVLPAKPGGSVSYGGLYRFEVSEAGTYQVSLGSGAWIEVVANGAAVASSAHAPGPACTTLKKTVAFPLKPGPYVLEITGAGAPVLPVMISRVG